MRTGSKISDSGEEDVILIDKESMKKIFYKFHTRLVEFAAKIVKEERIAEDAVGDMFVRLWTQRGKLKFADEKSLRNYLYLGTKMDAIAYLRKNKRDYKGLQEFAIFEESFQLPDEKRENLVSQLEAISFVAETISELPPQYRTVIEYVIEGKAYGEIARLMEITESSARGYKLKALAILRKKYEGNIGVAMTLLLINFSEAQIISDHLQSLR